MGKIFKTKDNWSPAAPSERGSIWMILLTLVLPALLVIGLLMLVVNNQGNIESAVANLTFLLPVGFAFSAGMVASVNPCGIVMLTTFAFQQLGQNKDKRTGRLAVENIVHALIITISFLIIFLGVGALISAGSQAILEFFPIAGFLVGAGMTVLGFWLMIKKKTLSLNIKLAETKNHRSSIGSDFLFGVSYAIASLSCTLPIFLVVAGSALNAETSLETLSQFGAYALGMGAVVLVVLLGSVLFKRGMARWLRAITPYVHRMSSFFLAAAGIYIMVYWINQGGLL